MHDSKIMTDEELSCISSAFERAVERIEQQLIRYHAYLDDLRSEVLRRERAKEEVVIPNTVCTCLQCAVCHGNTICSQCEMCTRCHQHNQGCPGCTAHSL